MEAAERVAKLLREYTVAHCQGDTLVAPTGSVQCDRWYPPKMGFFKMNCDGGTLVGDRKSGVGVVIRDGNGELIGAMSRKIAYNPSAEVIEAMAVWYGLTFAIDIGIPDIVIEGDASRIIHKLQAEEASLSYLDLIISDCKSLFAHFRSVSFSLVRWAGNHVAHSLASFGYSIDNDVVWLEEGPRSCLLNAG